MPPLGILNIHASLLPRWRGAAPIPASILAGDAETGATIMLVRLALDAGPMLGAARVPISASDTTATLTPKVANEGAKLLMEVLPGGRGTRSRRSSRTSRLPRTRRRSRRPTR